MILLGETTSKTSTQGNNIVTQYEMRFTEVLDRRMWRKTVVDAKRNDVSILSLPRTAYDLGLTFSSRLKQKRQD